MSMAAAAKEEKGAIEIEIDIEESGIGSRKVKFEMDKGVKEERGVKRRIQIQIEGFGKLSFETEKAAKKERGMLTFQIHFTNLQKKLSFETEKSVPLRRVFQDFYDRLHLVYGSVRFVFDGRTIREDQTPENCHIQDGDVIDAWVIMRG